MTSFNPHTLSLTLGWVLSLTLGGMALLLWTAKIEKRLIAFFAVMCLAWGARAWMSAYNLTGLELGWHIGTGALAVLPSALVLVFLGAQTLLILQVIGDLTRARVQSLIWRGFTGVALVAVLFYAGYGLLGLRIWVTLACFVVMVLSSYRLFKRGYTKRTFVGRWQTLAMVTGHAVFVTCAGVDLLVAWGYLQSQTLWVHWGFSALLFSYGAAAASYVLKAWQIEESLKSLLAQQVEQTTHTLNAAHDKLRQQETLLARADERSSMTRELHDGLGGNLIAALRTLEQPNIDASKVHVAHELLQESLDDLRMLMDSHHGSGHLIVALASWRGRWDTRLQTLGITLIWHIDDSVDDVVLTSTQTLHLLRILQEATNNTIKHAKATKLVVQASCTDHNLVLCIFDNGIGLEANTGKPSQGLGLKSLISRGLQLGAVVKIGTRADGQSSDELKGTQVQVVLPLAPPPI